MLWNKVLYYVVVPLDEDLGTLNLGWARPELFNLSDAYTDLNLAVEEAGESGQRVLAVTSGLKRELVLSAYLNNISHSLGDATEEFQSLVSEYQEKPVSPTEVQPDWTFLGYQVNGMFFDCPNWDNHIGEACFTQLCESFPEERICARKLFTSLSVALNVQELANFLSPEEVFTTVGFYSVPLDAA